MKNLRALLIMGIMLGLLAGIGGGLLFIIGYLYAPNVNQPLWQEGRALMLFGVLNIFVYIGIFFQSRKLFEKKC